MTAGDGAALARDEVTRPAAAASARMPHLLLVLAAVYGVSAVVLVGVRVASVVSDRATSYFTREPATAVSEAGCEDVACSYVGALSNLGVLVFAAGAVTCLLVAYLARAQMPAARSPFLYAGLLTGALLVDDMFSLHDSFLPAYVPHAEILIYAGFAAAATAIVVAFRAFLRRTTFALIPVAGIMFAVSVLLDRYYPGHHLIEDGSKFLGIVTWTTYWIGTALAFAKASGTGPAPLPGADGDR